MKEILRDKKKIILVIFICLFAVSLVYRVTHPFKQPKVAELTYTDNISEEKGNKVNRKNEGILSVQNPLIKLDLFLNPPAHSRDLKKNIFSEQSVVDVKETPLPERKVDQTAANETIALDNKNNVEDDLSSFRTFGYMESMGEKILFIEKGKQIMLIRKGDRIEGKYLVKDITKKELILIVIANNESVHIDLNDL